MIIILLLGTPFKITILIMQNFIIKSFNGFWYDMTSPSSDIAYLPKPDILLYCVSIKIIFKIFYKDKNISLPPYALSKKHMNQYVFFVSPSPPPAISQQGILL